MMPLIRQDIATRWSRTSPSARSADSLLLPAERAPHREGEAVLTEARCVAGAVGPAGWMDAESVGAVRASAAPPASAAATGTPVESAAAASSAGQHRQVTAAPQRPDQASAAPTRTDSPPAAE